MSNQISAPLVSIILRANNQEHHLRRLRSCFEQQEIEGAFEVVLLDHASHDATAAFAQESGWIYQHIPAGGFNYATALNQGVFLAHGEYCVSLSANCMPQSRDWLAQLLAPLQQNPQVVATYGPVSTRPTTTRRFFTNTNSAFRRRDALQHPFNPVVKIHEDILFALELADHELVENVPDAIVVRDAEASTLRSQVRRWQREGWARYLMTKQRGMKLPEALSSAPGHPLVRRLVQAAGYLHAWLRRDLIAVLDNQHQQRVMQGLRRSAHGTLSDMPLDWSEEAQLKADWGFIRSNIAAFILDCHTQGHLCSPILEIGASGQNDYLAEWYTMNTSNLATNLQGASMPLDMEDMHTIAADSYGTVLCSEVIEHVRHPDRAIAEAFRIVQPGGTLIVTTPYQIVIHNTTADGGFHGRNFTPQGLELLFLEAGFEIMRLETRGQTPTRQRLMPSNVFIVGRKPSLCAE